MKTYHHRACVFAKGNGYYNRWSYHKLIRRIPRCGGAPVLFTKRGQARFMRPSRIATRKANRDYTLEQRQALNKGLALVSLKGEAKIRKALDLCERRLIDGVYPVMSGGVKFVMEQNLWHLPIYAAPGFQSSRLGDEMECMFALPDTPEDRALFRLATA